MLSRNASEQKSTLFHVKLHNCLPYGPCNELTQLFPCRAVNHYICRLRIPRIISIYKQTIQHVKYAIHKLYVPLATTLSKIFRAELSADRAYSGLDLIFHSMDTKIPLHCIVDNVKPYITYSKFLSIMHKILSLTKLYSAIFNTI